MVGPSTGRVNETVRVRQRAGQRVGQRAGQRAGQRVGQRVGQKTFNIQFCAWVFSLHVLNLINTVLTMTPYL